MKAVILAGGRGSRLNEITQLKPKPMVEIGDKPILWHIMKIFSAYGVNDFIICLGYKGYMIKEFFSNYFLHHSDVTVDIKNNNMQFHQTACEPWKVTLIDTGLETQTGGRLNKISSYLKDNEEFCFTYGDGLADIDIQALIDHHRWQQRLSTVTAVQPPVRFGAINSDHYKVNHFQEKPSGQHSWINGGFFVLRKDVINYIDGDHTIWEQDPMQKLAKNNQMSVYFHEGFWQPMDTIREKEYLDDIWSRPQPDWKVW